MTAVLPIRLETPRLVLRKPRMSDAQAIFDRYTQDDAVAKYMVWRPHVAVAESAAFISACIRAWEAAERMPYVLGFREAEHQPIGMLEARVMGCFVDIGYVLTRAHWGKRLMPEAIEALVESVLRLPDIYRVQALCDVDNTLSARTLEKTGFRCEGRLERYSVHPNISSEPRACWMYARCR